MIRIAVIGAGTFGRNHVRVASEEPRVRLTHIVDTNLARAKEHAALYRAEAASSIDEIVGHVDAAIVAAPTSAHAEIGCRLLEAGIDVLVEKPIAATLADADRLIDAAARNHRILQIGHLERFNPAIVELERIATLPLFFEIHRMSVFTLRSLDVDVVLDLMILSGRGPCPGPRRAQRNSRGGHFHTLAEGRYRQRSPGIRRWLRRQPDREPRLDGKDPQATRFSARPVHFARLREAVGRGLYRWRRKWTRIRSAPRRARRAAETPAGGIPGRRGDAKSAETDRKRGA